MVDAEYYAMGFKSANGKTLEALGLDRLVDDDYRLDNITWCCYPCNRTKNSIYTPEEMERLGTLISQIWAERRAEEASDTQVTLFPVTPRKAKPTVIAPMPVDRRSSRYTAATSKPKPKPKPKLKPKPKPQPKPTHKRKRSR
jgi:cell division septation protein DedD